MLGIISLQKLSTAFIRFRVCVYYQCLKVKLSIDYPYVIHILKCKVH